MTMTADMSRQLAETDRWVLEPIYWAQKFAGDQMDMWSGQEELWHVYGKLLNAKLKRWNGEKLTAEERRDANKFGISIMAGQGLGKGANISLLAYHYLYVLQTLSPKVVCTAPAGPQLHSSLWPEFGAWLKRSPILNECFEKNAHRIFLKDDAKRGDVMRIEPRTVQPNANPEDQKVVLAGIHATGVLYLVDEASRVPPAVFEPLEGGLTDPLSMMILTWNPTVRTGFAIDTHGKNREMWACLHWSGRTLRKEKHMNPGRFMWFNEDAQLVLERKYGADSDVVRVRVDGLPPKQASDNLIGFEDAMMATERVVDTLDTDPLMVAADVGGPLEGGDPSEIVVLRGPLLLGIHEYTEKDGHALGRYVVGHLRDQLMSLMADAQYAVGVDVIGVGRSTYDYLSNTERVGHLHAINVSELPLDPQRFHRLRDQIYWELAEAFMVTKEISLRILKQGGVWVDDELIAELTSIKWREVDGKIKVQGKGPSSGIPHVPPLTKSPNKADALAMAWYLYKHCCSRLPPAFQRRRRELRNKVRNWKTL